MTPKLAILIPTIEGREEVFNRCVKQMVKQMEDLAANNVVVIHEKTKAGEPTTGIKRNKLIQTAISMGCDYVAFFDDDDIPGPGYLKHLLATAQSGKDCGELWGSIYFSGKKGKPFHHSIIYNKWSENKYQYNRTPNHINCVRTEIMAAFPFPDQVFGEDGKQSEAMAAAGALKTMHPCEEVIYHYFTGQKDTDLEKEIIKELIA